MLISSRKIKQLSLQIRQIIDGQEVDLRDNREGALSVLQDDIQALAQMKREQVEILEKDQKILKDALADISHQLKTPLTSALVMIDLLESAPPKKREEFIRNIKANFKRVEWLVQALLDRAKLEGGTVEFKKEKVSSADLIERAVVPLSIQIELKNINIDISGESIVYCDVCWTAEALANIIKNAVEHSPEDATIFIESGENPLYAWISVTDQGSGIPRDKIAKVFHRFETSGNEAGYGIGLPLALAIVRGQGGDIEIKNCGINQGVNVTLKIYSQET